MTIKSTPVTIHLEVTAKEKTKPEDSWVVESKILLKR